MSQASRLVPPRYDTLLWVLLVFVGINLATRLGLLVFDGDAANFLPGAFLGILAIGLVNDLAAASYLLVPFALLALAFGNGSGGRRLHAIAATVLLALASFAFLFTALAEGTFWNEFSSRFNFIAVDYLVYTREVLGNIWQSYPIGWLLAGIGALAVALLWLVRKPFWRAASAEGGSLRARLSMSALLLALPVASFLLFDGTLGQRLDRTSARELAGDGYYEFMRAFRANDLDYFSFYRTMPEDRAEAILRQEFLDGEPDLRFTGRPNLDDIVGRPVTGSRPRISACSSSWRRHAEPRAILTSSAVRSPRAREKPASETGGAFVAFTRRPPSGRRG